MPQSVCMCLVVEGDDGVVCFKFYDCLMSGEITSV